MDDRLEATAALPLVAGSLPALCVARAAVGLGEGISPPAAVDLIARRVPPTERARAVALTLSGLNVGSVLGLLLAPAVIDSFGWRTVFYLFGGLGLVWVAFAPRLYDGAEEDASALGDAGDAGVVLEVAQGGAQHSDSLGGDGQALELEHAPSSGGERRAAGPEGGTAAAEQDASSSGSDQVEDDGSLPWGAFFGSSPVRALAFTHFCNNWGHYVLLAWLPTFYSEELGVGLQYASLLALLPPLTNIAVASVAATIGDSLIADGGWDATITRKTMQGIAFLAPAACMMSAAFADEPAWTVGLLSLGLGLSSFSVAGLYSNHQDLSPKYASALLGITNTAGALPGVFGVSLTGYLLAETGSWDVALLLPTICCYFAGTAVFLTYGSAEPQDFRSEPDSVSDA